MLYVCLHQRIDLAAITAGVVLVVQQLPNLLQGHVQRPAIADEQQAFFMGAGIDPVVTFAARRHRQQPRLFVVADGHRLTTGTCRQLAYLHARLLDP